MNLTRAVLATALVAAAGITVVGIAAAEPATVTPTALPVTADATLPAGQPAPAAAPAQDEGITPEAAAEAAVAHVGGGRVESIEREVEHGVPVWDVDVIRDGVEHDVDVATKDGAILRVDRDDDHDDDRWDDDGNDDRWDDRWDDRQDD